MCFCCFQAFSLQTGILYHVSASDSTQWIICSLFPLGFQHSLWNIRRFSTALSTFSTRFSTFTRGRTVIQVVKSRFEKLPFSGRKAPCLWKNKSILEFLRVSALRRLLRSLPKRAFCTQPAASPGKSAAARQAAFKHRRTAIGRGPAAAIRPYCPGRMQGGQTPPCRAFGPLCMGLKSI